MKIVFLPEADADIDRLYNFLVSKNQLAAQKAMHAIDEGLDLLADNPMLGREMSDRPAYRQLFIPYGRDAYVLRYRIEGEVLAVIRVWHSRENRNS